MYLLDTNVVAETRKTRPAPRVIAWLEAAERDSLYLSVLTLGEIRKGVAKLRPRDFEGAGALARWLDGVGERFAERVLPVDAAVADKWGDLAGAGRTLPVIDGLLAATASVHGLTLVTRDVGGVAGTGVTTLNPWDA